MTTFQAIVFGAMHGLTEFLPVSARAHRILLAYMTGWPEPEGRFLGALSLASALALLTYFIHDWLSMVSCFLQILIYRKKPMTLDERMPLFIFVGTLPIGIVWYYFHDELTSHLDATPPVVAASLVGFGLVLGFADRMSRKNKNLYDWNWFDAACVGVLELAALIPGCGRAGATMSGGLFRNHSRESAAKFGFHLAVPVLIASAIARLHGLTFHATTPMPDTTWLTFIVSFVVAYFMSLLGIGVFMKHIQRGGMGQYVMWRFLMAIGIGGLYWFRNYYA